MLLLEANDALTLLEYDIVPLAHATICLHLADREFVLVAEPDFVHPVLARFDTNLADRAIGWQIHTRIALVDTGVSCEGRGETVAQMELH